MKICGNCKYVHNESDKQPYICIKHNKEVNPVKDNCKDFKESIN